MTERQDTILTIINLWICVQLQAPTWVFVVLGTMLIIDVIIDIDRILQTRERKRP